MPSGMDSVVQLINRLQGAATLLGDNAAGDKSLPSLWAMLPSIVVIGGQSSGKSSVLEAVVGKDFLPRGTGIVTRRPLILQLVHLDDPNAQEYGEFLHQGKQKIYDFKAIRNEIEAETMRYLQVKGKAVSPDPIQLTVYSPDVPNLTLVDMPGLTKVPIDGQPKSIVRELEEMARTYVKGDNAIILAVSPANADLATSDAIHLAKDVDPLGERTIGVLTKLDIMDPGTNAREVLENSAVHMKNGWIGIVNRGQADIVSNMPMEAARKKELDFFTNSPHYSDLKNVGTSFLANKLSNHLVNAIRKQLPIIQNKVNDSIVDLEKELESLGGPTISGRGGMVHTVLQMCRLVEETFAKMVDGGKGGGEQILTVFEKRLSDNIKRLEFDKILRPENVKRIVEEADGYQPHLIAPEMGYRRLLQECIVLFKGPADTAVDETHRILRNIVANVLESPECKSLQQYTHLKREISVTAGRALEKFKEDARKMVVTMVEMERSYLTAEVFREILQQNGRSSESGEIIRTLSGRPLGDVSDLSGASPAETHLRRIAIHVSAYIAHVRTQLKQTVPKAVVHCLVMQSKKKLLDEMNADVASGDDQKLKRLLAEDEGTMKRREAITYRLKLLKEAANEISSASY